MKQVINTLSCTAYCWNNRHSKQLSQFFMVKRISAMKKRIIHIQRHNHTDVHINKLSSQV